METTIAMQYEYQRLIKNLSGYSVEIRDPLIKSVSSTKTALDALDNKILDDKVSGAVKGFLGVLCSLNDVLEFVPPSPVGIESESEFNPVTAKRKKSAKDSAVNPEPASVESDGE